MRAPESQLRRVTLVTYAAGERFEETQRRLDESLEVAEIQGHWPWNASSFEEGAHGAWFRRHSSANFRRGGAWKPYVIWQAFRRVQWGDWLIYHDASQYIMQGFSSSVQPLLEWLESQREENPCECIAAVRLRQTLQHEWQQRCVPAYGEPRDFEHAFDTFCGLLWRIGACVPSAGSDCCTRTWRQPQLQHAWSVWRKNRRSARFLRDWADLSADRETIAHLPFIDQSLNALLVYRHANLGIRPLWAPSLYEMAWEQDLDFSTLGRNDGYIFKHMNFVLDAFWNQGATGRRLLHFFDPARPPPDSPLDKVAAAASARSPRMLHAPWDERTAGLREWRRSLCLRPPGRPALAGSAMAAQLLLHYSGPGTERLGDVPVHWSGRLRAPVGWWAPLYNAPKVGDVPWTWRKALASPPRELTAAIGEEALFGRGLSAALSLGTWRVGDLTPGVPAPEVIADVVLLNDGEVAWPAGASLCRAGGNASRGLQAYASCQVNGERHPSETCSELPTGEVLHLRLSVQLPEAAADRGERQLARWALCGPGGSQPFGVLLQAIVET